jgi:hypothetical protein
MTCAKPIHPDVLADYWLAVLPAAQEQAIEEHLFACEDCSRRLQSTADLAAGIHTLAKQGNLPLIVTQDFLDRLHKEGLRARQYSVSAGAAVECTVTPQDDFLIGRLAADLTGVDRLDLSMCEVSGEERVRLRDIPFRGGVGEVILNYPMAVARQSGPDVLVMKLLSVDQRGERVLGEYTFRHTPTAL